MNFKKLYFPANLKTIKNIDSGDVRSSRSFDFTEVISNTGKTSENNLILQLQEKEELIALLEKLVEKRTDKLIDVVAVNTKFLSIVAHDLKSPFNSIIGALELLAKNLHNYNLDEIEEYVNIASNSAYRTLNLVDDLLSWAISHNKEINFTPVKIKLNKLLADEIAVVCNSANHKQITILNSIASELNVFADLHMVKTIFRNLIVNAIKFTKPGGKIKINAIESKQFVEIAIKDDGIGISFEAQKNLFKIDRYRSTAGTNNEKGTGLGLILCKELVEMHGGDIRIESEPGEGFEIKFTLPNYI